MIRRLRIRVIVSAILAFLLVIVSVSILVNVINYRIVTNQADETLDSILDFENQKFDKRPGFEFEADNNKPPIPPFMGRINPEAEYITRFFIVRYDDRDNIIQVVTDNISNESKEYAEDIGSVAIEREKDRGYIKEYRYLRGKDTMGNIVVFLNVWQDQQHLRTLRIITIIVDFLSLLIVSILVIIFSRTAIRPIVQNIERQKCFITDASHELKTPLTSIMTSLDVLEIESGTNEWTDNIRSQSIRMTKLVGELVALSRLDEAKPLSQKEEFSVSDISWEMLELYEGSAKAKELAINTEIEENLVLQGDRAAFGQMISVLLDNAIKYTKGEGEIYYKAYRKHNKINIEILNPTDYKNTIDVTRLFDRFYRPDTSRNSSDGGSGIGLSIAKAVAEAHGGTIEAKCPSGKQMIIKVKI